MCKPPMLILDEATSSIDTRTEIRIQKAFSRLMQGRTTFIVAHRLATIKEADIIVTYVADEARFKPSLSVADFVYVFVIILLPVFEQDVNAKQSMIDASTSTSVLCNFFIFLLLVIT